MKCPECNGKGEVYICSDPPHHIDEYDVCRECRGEGSISFLKWDKLVTTKHHASIQPVRLLAMRATVFRDKLRATLKRFKKTSYKNRRQARMIIKQGKYIEELKAQLKNTGD